MTVLAVMAQSLILADAFFAGFVPGGTLSDTAIKDEINTKEPPLSKPWELGEPT